MTFSKIFKDRKLILDNIKTKDMKKINSILVLLCMLIITQSCKKDDPADDFRDPSKAACLLAEIASGEDTTLFSYNDESKITKLEWNLEEYMEITYDSDGKVSRIDEFYPGNETYYTLYTWSNDEIEAIYYELVQEEWVSSSKRISELNGNKEVVKITDYSKNANEWIKDGDYFLFEWKEGNMTKAENWDNYSTPGSKATGLVKKNPSPFISAKEAYTNNRSIKSKKDEYNLYSTALIEYDGKINPLRYLTMGNLIDPDEFNTSKNNWAKKTFTDINNRVVTSIYTYLYDEKSFPTKLDIEETRVYPSGTIINNYSKNYSYNCK